MNVDIGRLDELIVESQDLQSDALRVAKDTLPALADLRHTRVERDPAEVLQFNLGRRRLLRNGGLGLTALASRGLLATSFGAAVVGIVARPAAAQSEVSVQVFQTAASLENLAVATYGAALGLPGFDANKVVQTFATTTMKQHSDHRDAFNAQTKKLGGAEQTATNPKYTPVVEEMKPTLVTDGQADYAKIVALAATLEEVAQDTYIANLSLLPADETRTLMASVLAVETQHLATLRAVGALLSTPELIAIPTDPAKLPAAAGSVAFPKAFEEADKASPPEEGAVK